MKRSLHVRLDNRVFDDLSTHAGMRGRTKSAVVEEALCHYLSCKLYPNTGNGQQNLNGYLYHGGRLDEVDRKAARR